MYKPVTIVQFRVFDKDLEKNFYNGETVEEIHKVLKEIGQTYIAKNLITVVYKSTIVDYNIFNELKQFQPNES